jgi:Ca2+-binding RTX toxin-like protein
MADLISKQIFTFGDSIYLLSTVGTWGTAQAEALSFQGNLVTINNEAEQTFLASLFAGKESWIGYNDAGVEGTFQWASGETSAYTNWLKTQPDNYFDQEDFGTLGPNGSWSDRPGSNEYQGIIEIKNTTTPVLAIADLSIIEPYDTAKQVLFTVQRFGNSSNSVSVNYSTANGTGVAGVNYTTTSGTLTFNPGETTKTIGVTVNRDADLISGETFTVNLSSPTNAILGDNQAKATIYEATETVTFGDSTYILTNLSNWGEAQVQARAFGGNLVTINSAEEQAFLAGVYAGQELWIGYSDAGKEWNITTGEGFQWVNGTSAYTNWAINEPNDYFGEEDFVTLTGNGSWNDRPGYSKFKGIVEIPNSVIGPKPPNSPDSSAPTDGNSSNDVIIGAPGNTNLIGDPEDDILLCSNRKEILTGGAGADLFVYAGSSQKAALKKSSIKALDRITDFNVAQGDRIQLDFDNNRSTAHLPRQLFDAKDVLGKTLIQAVKSAYADRSDQPGNQVLKAREAVLFEWRKRTYLSVNDSNRSFTASRDLVIDVTGITAGALTVSNYFV